MNYINTSIFDLFKIGPGPSSSHTIGPMKAALSFYKSINKLSENLLSKANSIDVYLYGSLSATGKGHGTDKAIVAGLLGNLPASCDIDFLSSIFSKNEDIYIINASKVKLIFSKRNIHFGDLKHHFPYQNTLVFQLKSNSDILFEDIYYSTGGGFIIREGDQQTLKYKPIFEYSNMNELKDLVIKNELSIKDIMLSNEIALSGLSEKEIDKKLENILNVMEKAVVTGLEAKRVLPGPIKLRRKAYDLYLHTKKIKDGPDRFLICLNSYAIAVSEENADGHMVVTAPTSGACGIIPALIYLLRYNLFVDIGKIKHGLIVAAAIGMIAKHNASISGAEVGCQGEIGVASSMGAALLSEAFGKNIEIIENAAEIALEHHLGLTCDPVRGYVQIPCIERNAVGAVKAYNAYLLASYGDYHKQKIGFDEVVMAMLKTGKDMQKKYKETAKGGLAVCSINC